MDSIQQIVDMIVYESSFLKCQDEVSAIHSILLEVENRLMDVSRDIKKQEPKIVETC